MNHKIIVYEYLHILHINIYVQHRKAYMLPCNRKKKNNIYTYTLTLSCKHVILDKRLCKYFTCEYAYTMKACDE